MTPVRELKPDPVIQLLLRRLISASSSQLGDKATAVPSVFPNDSSRSASLCAGIYQDASFIVEVSGRFGKDLVLFPVSEFLRCPL